MKRSLLLLALIICCISCSDDLQTNSPSIQGQVNGSYFRTTNTSATIGEDGSLTIHGKEGIREVNLTTANFERGTFTLGENTASEATYRTFDSTFYRTGTLGEGEITIRKIENGTVSGEFYFYANEDSTDNQVNFSKGSFIYVPVDNATETDPDITCEEATTARNNAAEAFTQAGEDADDFSSLCNDYRTALQQEIDVCGDEDGYLQTLADALPCNDGPQIDCSTAQTAVEQAQNAYEQTSPDNELQFQTVCNAYRAALEGQIIACGDDNGDIQSIIDGLDCGN